MFLKITISPALPQLHTKMRNNPKLTIPAPLDEHMHDQLMDQLHASTEVVDFQRDKTLISGAACMIGVFKVTSNFKPAILDPPFVHAFALSVLPSTCPNWLYMPNLLQN